MNDPTLQVDALHGRLGEPSAPEEGPNRKGTIAYVERSRANLEQQRSHDQKIVTAHQDDFDVRVCFAKSLQVPRGIDAAEPAAQYYDPHGRAVRMFGHGSDTQSEPGECSTHAQRLVGLSLPQYDLAASSVTRAGWRVQSTRRLP